MILPQLVKLNKANGGHFFDPELLRANRETMKGFSFKDNHDGTGTLSWKNDSHRYVNFDLKTGRVVHSAPKA